MKITIGRITLSSDNIFIWEVIKDGATRLLSWR
jgi:hypothetical protein